VLVATPIGNLGDLSPRATQVLASADVVCCEDTRRTRQLLAAAGIPTPRLVALHRHSEAARTGQVVAWLQTGQTVALATDAGTPGISDPGARLVAAALAAGIRVTAVPGPNAAVTALVLSGLPTDRFCFEGFLPRQGPERRRRLALIAADERTTVLHEAANRLAGTLADLAAACGGQRPVVVARELTKLHEELWRGSAADAAATFAQRPVRGEVVVVVHGAPPPGPPGDEDVTAALAAHLDAGRSRRDAAAAVAGALGVSRHRAYELALHVEHHGRRSSSDDVAAPKGGS